MIIAYVQFYNNRFYQAGICEVLFEKVSLGYFFKEEELMKAVMASEKGLPQLKSLAKSVLVSMGVNISEEVCTDIANEITDRMINGELSEYSLRLAEYLKEGYSEKEAKRRCAIDFGKQLGNTVISSGIMVLALSGGLYDASLKELIIRLWKYRELFYD